MDRKEWLRGNLFLGGEIAATFAAGKHLVRVAAHLGIKHTAQFAHGVEVRRGELARHEIDFLDANAVLPGHASAQLKALAEDVFAFEEDHDMVRKPPSGSGGSGGGSLYDWDA